MASTASAVFHILAVITIAVLTAPWVIPLVARPTLELTHYHMTSNQLGIELKFQFE